MRGLRGLRRRTALAGLVVLAAVAWPDRPADEPGPVGPGTSSFGLLGVYVPARAPAGTPVTVDVAGAAPASRVALTFGGALGTGTLTSVAGASGVARFSLPRTAGAWAGLVSLTARSGALTGTADVRFFPGPVADPVTAVVGPRSILAGSGETSMAVAVPMDRNGNAPEDGTPVTFRRVLPGGAASIATTRTARLLAWREFPSTVTAGRDLVHAAADGASGPATTLITAASRPVPFDLSLVGQVPSADGRSLAEVRTSLLRDPYGNVEPDGTLVTLTGNGPDGSWSLTGVAVGGVARFAVQAPDLPGTVQLAATCHGTVSRNPLSVGFAANGVTLPATAVRDGDDLVVDVGPIHDGTGAQVADGSEVTVAVTDGAGRTVRNVRATVDGRIRLRLAVASLLRPVTVRISALGSQSPVTVR
ncbi:MAG: hypothetical protein QG622_914 [Actinomycetota bacterium]|nr:hypothetical protein [Actinomycetota bacterium]